MRRILYIAIAVLGLAGVATAAVVTGNDSAQEQKGSCGASAEKSDDCSWCPFKAIFD